jgi:putative membrane protein
MHSGKCPALWAAVSAILLVVGGCSSPEGRKATEEPAARGAGVGSGGAGANLTRDDEFVHDLASKNLEEIELSRMALNRATSAEVKAFAQMMIQDHSAAVDRLKSVISGASFAWPDQLDEKHREAAEDLAKKQGSDFDREYVKAMVEGHQNLAAKLEGRLDTNSLAEWKTAAAGRTQTRTMPDKVAMTDVQVRPNQSGNATTMKVNQWAADTYPVAQKHLDTARALENSTTRQ